jgi:hypothetical protein
VTNEAGFLLGGKIRSKKTLAVKSFQKFNARPLQIFQKFFFKTSFLFLKIRLLKSSVAEVPKIESGKNV